VNLPKIEIRVRKLARSAPAGPEADVLAALALRLARTLDEDAAGSQTAAVARELRACVDALVPDRDEADGLDELLDELRR
jgi:hypothetical protein